MKFSMFSASFEARPLSANFFIISHVFQLVKNFFQLFSKRFFCPFPCEPLPLFCCFCSCRSPWQLDYLTKDIRPCQRIFASFFAFFWFLFYKGFTCLFTSGNQQHPTPCKHLLWRLCRRSTGDCGAGKSQSRTEDYNVWKTLYKATIFAEIRLSSHAAHLSRVPIVYNKWKLEESVWKN